MISVGRYCFLHHLLATGLRCNLPHPSVWYKERRGFSIVCWTGGWGTSPPTISVAVACLPRAPCSFEIARRALCPLERVKALGRVWAASGRRGPSPPPG